MSNNPNESSNEDRFVYVPEVVTIPERVWVQVGPHHYVERILYNETEEETEYDDDHSLFRDLSFDSSDSVAYAYDRTVAQVRVERDRSRRILEEMVAANEIIDGITPGAANINGISSGACDVMRLIYQRRNESARGSYRYENCCNDEKFQRDAASLDWKIMFYIPYDHWDFTAKELFIAKAKLEGDLPALVPFLESLAIWSEADVDELIYLECECEHE